MTKNTPKRTKSIAQQLSDIAAAKKKLVAKFHSDIQKLYDTKRANLAKLRATEAELVAKLTAEKAAAKAAKAETKIEADDEAAAAAA